MRIERRTAPELGPRVERWKLIAANGDTVRAIWRRAPPTVPRPWTAVMLGGLDTGERASLLLPETSGVNALAVGWPWRGPLKLSPKQFISRLPQIQRAALRSAAVLALGAEAAARVPEVDASRVVLVGASLGAPPALAALRLTRVPDALVLLDGAADLGALIRAGLMHEGWPAAKAAPTAALAYGLVWPLEPSLHTAAAARLPVLLINGLHDERLPRACVDKLRASLPSATVRWRKGGHLDPGQPDMIARITAEAEGWLRALSAPPVPAGAGKPAPVAPPGTKAPTSRPSAGTHGSR